MEREGGFVALPVSGGAAQKGCNRFSRFDREQLLQHLHMVYFEFF